MVLTVGDDIGACFSGSRAHFQIRKCALFHMKDSNKIAAKIGQKIGMVLIVGDDIGHIFQGPGHISKMENSNQMAEKLEEKMGGWCL